MNIMSSSRAAGSALDRSFAITFFESQGAGRKHEERFSLRSLANRIHTVTASEKSRLPWLKLARFGEERTEKGSLRHDANVLAISGIEADYDGEQISLAEAVERLTKADLLALAYTSPSHTEAAPRWRVLCPLSEELPPDRRIHLLGRLNGVFDGALSGESWTLSQSYYFGSVRNNPAHQVALVEGTPIDQLDELDELWRGKPNTGKAVPAHGSTGFRSGPLDEAALAAEIVSGANYHQASLRLLGRWAFNGVPVVEARQKLIDLMEGVFPADRDARWAARRAAVDRCVQDIYGREAKALDEGRSLARQVKRDEGDGTGPVTEDSVAAAFVERHRDSLRFCHHAGTWYRWTGAVWQREETRLAFDWARNLARQCAASAGEGKAITAAGKAAFASGVERFVQADRAFAVTSAAWDRDPWLLGTPEGTVDLRTGEVRPARQEDLISRSTAVTPAPQAQCPTWLAFLLQACAGDQDLIGFLQRWFGYCLTGVTQEHALLFVYGPGGNGKGVLLVTMAGILGAYATNAAMDTFTASQGDRHPTDLAMLHGARMVMTTETEEGRAWAEARIKALTGGDPVTARYMRQDFFTFTPAFKLTISGNHKPALRNVDDAARRRFNVVPFLHKPSRPDPTLADKLRAEWPGILRWMIEGCLAWQQDGLQRPEAVLDATAEYFAEQDVLAQWVEECCDQSPDWGDANTVLFTSWRSYAVSRAEDPRSAKWFATMLERQGFMRAKDCRQFRGRGFLGIRVKPDTVQAHWQERDG
jgi:putative DNA primase/helicase